jgi:glycosyltransferase involved in cell wall biosynthesis
MRLAIVTTHPIQYNAPVFRELAQRPGIDLKVFYGWSGGGAGAVDPGFGQAVTWDIPLLDGYDHEFVPNVSRDPGSHHYSGIDLPTLPQRLREWRAEAVLVYGWRYKAHLKILREFHGRMPVLFRGDSTMLSAPGGLKGLVRRQVLRWVYRHVDVALAVGTQSRRYFLAHGLREEQVVHAPHAVDNARLCAAVDADTDLDAARRELAVTPQQVLAMFVGKLEPIKWPEGLLAAHRRLGSAASVLAYVGSGPLQESLRQAATDGVRFLGFQNQSRMPHFYRLADVLVLPSHSETWGLVLNEAMACGRAVIASDRVGAAVDLIQPEQNGWIFRAGDVDDLARCLSLAIQRGRTGLAAMGLRSSELIRDWSITRQVDGFVEGLQRCR